VARGAVASRRGLQSAPLAAATAFVQAQELLGLHDGCAATTKDRAKDLRRRMSLPEVLLWRAIKGRKLHGLQFRKQHPLGPYVLDFYCDAERLAVEVDGASHGFGNQPERDERRDAWLSAQGITTLRLAASLVLQDVDNATRTILAHLEDAGRL
jgi:very-short-patch-repair endonuclease